MRKKEDFKIAAVVVTYNRLNKLKKALLSYENQLHKPDYMIIVDNASNDGTPEWLNEWQSKTHGFIVDIIRAEKNLGGSGGFYLGQKKAMETGADWIMLADDDAYPANDYIMGLYKYILSNVVDDISVVCGAVEENGSLYNHHRSVIKKFKYQLNFLDNAPKENYKKTEFYINHASYVGILINALKLKKVGLVDKDFFIWWDDAEHIIRLGKVGRFICLPSIIMQHDVESINKALSWKSYYGCRNKLICHKRHMPFTFIPIVIFLGFKTILAPLKGKSIEEVKMRFVAIKDAILDNMGMNSTYKPGWKP